MLPPIEVVGSIQPFASPSVGSGVPARVTIISGAEIDAPEPRILSDVLQTQAGFSTYDDLGTPYKLNVSSRGFFASPVVGLPQGVAVFLDGVRQNEPDAAQVNFDLLPLEHVKRIELLSGNGSLLGRNALGGAVNLVTRRGEGPLNGEIELMGGTFGAFSAEASLGATTKDGLRLVCRRRLQPRGRLAAGHGGRAVQRLRQPRQDVEQRRAAPPGVRRRNPTCRRPARCRSRCSR